MARKQIIAVIFAIIVVAAVVKIPPYYDDHGFIGGTVYFPFSQPPAHDKYISPDSWLLKVELVLVTILLSTALIALRRTAPRRQRAALYLGLSLEAIIFAVNMRSFNMILQPEFTFYLLNLVAIVLLIVVILRGMWAESENQSRSGSISSLATANILGGGEIAILTKTLELRMSVLTAEQIRQYEDEGYLLVSGLIEPEMAAAGAAALWRGLGADPIDKASWANVPKGSGHNAPEIMACFTPLICAAAAELAGEGLPQLPAPSSTYTLNIFPQEGPWRQHGPHIDHALEKNGYKVFPRPMRIASIIYLNDVPENGAPTVVWPGSYKKIEALAKSDPAHYELMMTLNRELDKLDLGEPAQVPSKQGDILFYHYLTAHSGSTNATDQPRLALVHKW